MCRLLSRQGIRDICRLLTENSKRFLFLFYVSDENSASENFEMEKNLLITKKKQKNPPASSMTPACAFLMNRSSVQAIHSEGKGRIPVSIACFNYSIAEV